MLWLFGPYQQNKPFSVASGHTQVPPTIDHLSHFICIHLSNAHLAHNSRNLHPTPAMPSGCSTGRAHAQWRCRVTARTHTNDRQCQPVRGSFSPTKTVLLMCHCQRCMFQGKIPNRKRAHGNTREHALCALLPPPKIECV